MPRKVEPVYESVQEYLKRYPLSYDNYKPALYQFCECLGLDVNDTKPYFKAYQDGKRSLEQYFRDIEKYFTDVLLEKAPASRRTYIVPVSKWFRRNGISFSEDRWDDFDHEYHFRDTEPQNQRSVPTPEQVRQIINSMPFVPARTFYLMLKSSGMRFMECLKLTWEQVDLTSDPIRISILPHQTKTRKGRTTFIDSEAREALLQYKNHQHEYRETHNARRVPLIMYWGKKRNKEYNLEADKHRVFPWAPSTMSSFWASALKEVQLDQNCVGSTRFKKFTPHKLRGFFRKYLAKSGDRDNVEALMGWIGPLRSLRARYTDSEAMYEELAKWYKENETYVHVFSMVDTGTLQHKVHKITEDLVNTKTRAVELDEKVLALYEKNESQREKVEQYDKLSEEHKDLKRNYYLTNRMLMELVAKDIMNDIEKNPKLIAIFPPKARQQINLANLQQCLKDSTAEELLEYYDMLKREKDIRTD